METINLSKNFTLSEATRSSMAIKLKIDNSLSPKLLNDTIWFAQNVLQPIRDKIGKPFIITSWYRSPALNKAVKGKDTSAHLSGTAIDFCVQGHTASESWDIVLVALKDLKISFDQCINERNSKNGAMWVHLASKKTGNRNQSFKLIV